MNCFDCTQERKSVPAVAVCCHCGTGVCAEHLVLRTEEVHHDMGTGPSWGKRSARRATCPTCNSAEQENPAT
ncbi:DUF2180 family protein [Streptomyces niger]|uniref:DUF2180 family protein n=1 Tax=Streptomyces niger TaxID=66373 RepID=UPI0018FEFC6D